MPKLCGTGRDEQVHAEMPKRLCDKENGKSGLVLVVSTCAELVLDIAHVLARQVTARWKARSPHNLDDKLSWGFLA